MRYLMNPFFDDMFDDWNAVSDSKFPPVDVYETSDNYILEAELPGYQESDLELHVENHTLHLSSKRRMPRHEQNSYLIKERAYVPFERTFSLPEHVDESAIKANFANGLLTIEMPKRVPVQPKRIDVKVN